MPSVDTKIQALLREVKSVGVSKDGRGQQQCLAKKKEKWPMWPALSLEHVAADEARIKKRGKKGHRMNVLVHIAPLSRSPVCCIYMHKFLV